MNYQQTRLIVVEFALEKPHVLALPSSFQPIQKWAGAPASVISSPEGCPVTCTINSKLQIVNFWF